MATTIVAALLSACGSDSSSAPSGAGAPGFDASKGWRLVQTLTNDDANISGKNEYGHQNVAKIGYCGLDVGTDARLRVFYWQGWQSQQDFLYRATRIDEFDASQQRVGRTELEFENEFLNESKNPYRRCLLRNGKSTILTQADIRTERHGGSTRTAGW